MHPIKNIFEKGYFKFNGSIINARLRFSEESLGNTFNALVAHSLIGEDWSFYDK